MAKVSDLKVGLEVAEEYFGPAHELGGAEHDIIFLLPPDVAITDEDKARLEKADWHYSERDGWYHNV